MRILMNIRIPHEPFNTAVREGTAGTTLQRIVEEAKPEAVYFTEQNGARGAVMVVQVNDSSEIPAFCEPWFLNFNADCEFRIAMTPPDLERAGLDKLGAKWR
ncbi:MAG: panthothenate synthetase [Acidobacteriota bacterium]|nr:panthothenate synthetase [Acidobacteriota bacterium]